MSDVWNEIFEDPKSPIAEEHDPSWKTNFKWAYDSHTEQALVWKTPVEQGLPGGRPDHRQEVEAQWGRPPRTTEGDVLGAATYIPPETKLDGTVVAPADIQIHPYYNAPVPAEIRRWFEDKYPQGIVRQAGLTKQADVGEGWHAEDGWDDSMFELPDVDDQTEDDPVYKWLWNKHDGLIVWETSNEDGLPTHTQKAEMEWDRPASTSDGDKLGYAYIDYPDEGVITLESFDDEIPHSAFEDVKEQLLEWFPHHQVITDDGPPEKHEFNSDPADYKSAAIAWANKHLGGTTLYHTAFAPHEEVMKNGIDYSLHPESASRQEFYDSEGLPSGNYLWNSVENARQWGEDSFNADDFRIYRVDASGLNLNQDPWFSRNPDDREDWKDQSDTPGSFFTQDRIPPDRLSLVYEQTFNPETQEWEFHGADTAPSLRPEAPVSPSKTKKAKTGLLGRIFSKKRNQKVADADMEGAMVALFIPEEAAKKIQIKGGEPIEQMHITLLYFQDKAADRDDWDEVKKIVEQVANQTPPMSGKVAGYGVFSNDDDVLWASPSVQGLAELRHKVFEACEDAGFHVSTDYDWVPHITLKYGWKGKLPEVKDVELTFDKLTFARGEDHDDFEFKGNFEKKATVPQVMYHAGWAEDVPSIQKIGLQPASPGAWSEVSGSENPEGVYLFGSLEAAQQYGKDREEPTAVWEVNTNGLNLQPDTIFEHEVANPHAWYSTDPIPPERLRRIAASDDYLDWPLLARKPGDQCFFEYHCYEGHDSSDAQAWYRSHQPVTIVSVLGSDTFEPEEGSGPQNMYRVRWADGYEHDVFDDELVDSPSEYHRPDPPMPRTAADDYLDWSGWEGAHRFVTDGKEILTDPESGGIDPSNWKGTEELKQKFLSFYPETKSPVVGWTVPTADKMGIGIWAPAAGHGDKHEPGLHEIIKIIEKELGKPAHIITNDEHLTNDKMYNPGQISEWQTIS